MHSTLISAAELAVHVTDPDWCVLDCRYNLQDPEGGAKQYAAGHLPGAAYVDLEHDLSGPRAPTSGRHPLPDAATLVQRLGALGVDERTQVIAYDASAGLFAARAWWLLRALGHGAVAVLDGDLAAWTAIGGAMTQQVSLRAPRRFPWRGRPLPDLTSADVAAGLAAKNLHLIDVRAAERFEGRVEPLDPVAGHVPGAVNLPQSLTLDASGHFRTAAELDALFSARLGNTPPQDVVCMCGSGVTACQMLLAMQIAGRSGAGLYAGSWSEWCRDPSRPVATGPA